MFPIILEALQLAAAGLLRVKLAILALSLLIWVARIIHGVVKGRQS